MVHEAQLYSIAVFYEEADTHTRRVTWAYNIRVCVCVYVYMCV